MIDYFVQVCKKEIGVAPVKELAFHASRKWRFDYAFPDAKVALEVEGGVWRGGRHINPRGFLGDMEKYNAAARQGWRVVRCTPDTLCTFATIQLLKDCIYGEKEGEK